MYPDFQYISFHEQSDRVFFFWKEKSSNMDGFSFHLVFFTENWKVFITSILMKTETLRSSAVTYISEFANILTTRL